MKKKYIVLLFSICLTCYLTSSSVFNSEFQLINMNTNINDTMECNSLVENFSEKINNTLENHIQNKQSQYTNSKIITKSIKYYSVTDEVNTDQELTIQSLSVPDNIDTSFKGFMDYRCITDTTTKQWELQQQAYTDDYGLRKINNDYCVALGSYFVDDIGDRFEVVLENDYKFTVIAADVKMDIHTDFNNQYVPMRNGMGNVVEFIVDDEQIHDGVWVLGDVGYYEEFEGNIKEINLLERSFVDGFEQQQEE